MVMPKKGIQHRPEEIKLNSTPSQIVYKERRLFFFRVNGPFSIIMTHSFVCVGENGGEEQIQWIVELSCGQSDRRKVLRQLMLQGVSLL